MKGIKHKKSSISLWSWLVIIGVFLTYWTVSRSYSGPAYLADEIGYLTNAAFLAGHVIDGASSYHAGYSLFLAPLFALFSEPGHVWQGAMIVNAVLWGISFYLLARLLNELSPESTERERFLALLAAAVYPAWVTMSGYVFATTCIVFVYMLSALSLLRWRGTGSWSIIPHSLCVGFLYWVHPTGIVVAVASMLAVSLATLRTRNYRPLALHIVLTVLLVVAYKKGVHQWLIISMTPDGYQPRLHYPSFSFVLRQFADFTFLSTHFVPKVMGQLSYIAVGSFGIALFGLAAAAYTMFRYLATFRGNAGAGSVIQTAVYAFLTLSVVGVVAMGSAGSGWGIHYWIYGRYVEGVLLPVLTLGFVTTWRFKWAAFSALFVIVTGAILEMVTKTGVGNNLVNIPAFWPLVLLPNEHFLQWMLVGALGIFIAGAAGTVGNAGKAVALAFMLIAGVACAVNQHKWHSKILSGYSAPSSLVEVVRLNFPEGSCIGFDPKIPEPSMLYQRERYNLYSFYFFNYRYRRMSPEEWISQCDGPLLTYNPSVFLGSDEASVVAREVSSGLYLVLKRNRADLVIPDAIRAKRDVYFVSPGNESCLFAGCFALGAHDLRKFSQVGELDKSFLRTNGKGGFLFYGPYVPLKKGDYKIVLRGDFFDTSGAVLDITSNRGTKVHAKAELDMCRTAPGAPIILYFSLNEDVQDIEVRLRVSDKSKIRVREYEILTKDASLEDSERYSMNVSNEYLEFMPRQVGQMTNEGLKSDGRAGFLSFGPYSPMKAGEYRLVVKGSASAVDSAWVDVVSQKGTVQHAKFPLAVTTEGVSGVLADGLVRLEAPVDDLEVRVYVGAQDRVQLEGYELTPVEAGRER